MALNGHKQSLRSKKMGYLIQAAIMMADALPGKLPPDLSVVRLDQNVRMIPLGDTALEKHDLPFLALLEENNTKNLPGLLKLLNSLRTAGRIAYIEAEYFGGEGTQAHILIDKDGEVKTAIATSDAINEALKWLGVPSGGKADEFDTIGLGRYRDTNDWLEPD
ncbi:hypothetical protein GTP58_11305 [Duganella sp. CY15W]|uniref:hypothetical protein n=1 Tax=Duganella sp. CY15W TaxID=2692172 RepID=UPI001368AB22|nr:hypothetical protein [Duganella sp. CY15W]MYM28910.1 hypothetical protein [Duganella sp. CY15W]